MEFIGTVNWNVTFTDGTYLYFCDAHPTRMQGTFTVGNPPTPTAPPSPQAVTPVTPASKLLLTSGPGFTITLKTTGGKTVKAMKTGTYAVIVRDRGRTPRRTRDRSRIRPQRRARSTYTGSQTWKVKLARAGTLRFLCDRHAAHRHEGFREDRPLAGATQTERPATRQTGPCVTAFSVSERACTIVIRPAIPSASMRSKQRRAIPGETP